MYTVCYFHLILTKIRVPKDLLTIQNMKFTKFSPWESHCPMLTDEHKIASRQYSHCECIQQ
jgi:hypothetical protein